MNEELLLTAMNLFDSPEKWSSFIELMNRNGEIQNRWWKKLQAEVYQREKQNSNPEWEIHIWNNWDIMWYLKGESNKSLAIHFWGDGFRVFSNYGDLDALTVNKITKEPRFDILKNCFDKIDGSNFETIGWEHRNFSFNTIFDGKFPDARTLSWYAGNKTEDFADQIISKVRKFQTPEVTALFREINNSCKK